MSRPRVYVDTNAHVPYDVSDLFGFLATYSVIELLWSEYLVAEVLDVTVRVARRKRPVAAQTSAARTSQWKALRSAFPRNEVTEARWRPSLDKAEGPDLDDHPHQAAAIAGRADVLVTSDKAGFPADALAKHGIRVQTADEFLCDLLASDTMRVVETLRNRSAAFRNPAMTTAQYIDVLASTLHRFADEAAEVCACSRRTRQQRRDR